MKNVSIEKARDLSRNKIVYQYELEDEDRLNEHYECIVCNKKISVHKNKNNLYYFQHIKDTCILDNLSSEEKKLISLDGKYRRSGRHSQYQDEIIKFLKQQNFTNITKEKSFYVNKKVQHRADIYFENVNHKFVIEVQISPLSFRNIYKRIEFYKSQGIYLLWVVDVDYIDTNIKQFLKDILEYGSIYSEIFSFNNSSNMLQVHYQEIFYWKNRNRIWKKYKTTAVNFNSLNFNEKDMTVYWYNREKIRKNLYIHNPMLLLNHIGYLHSDSDDDLVKKLKYYEEHYSWMSPKFLELIDAIFKGKYKYWEDGEYYDIVLFLIKSNMVKTLEFLLGYGLRRRDIYNPRIDEENYILLEDNNIDKIRKSVLYYYFLNESIPR